MPITTGMMSSNTDLWETPQDFFDELDREFHFELDGSDISKSAKRVEKSGKFVVMLRV